MSQLLRYRVTIPRACLVVLVGILLLASSAAEAASVTLTWNAVSGPTLDGYRLFARRSDQAYNYSRPDWEGTATRCTLRNLEDSTDYFFVVRAYSGVLESPDSEEAFLAGAPAGAGGQPYGGTPWPVPGTIMAVDFDEGGQGVAYHDKTSVNRPGHYRPEEDVDIARSADGYFTKSNRTGEWRNYTIEVTASGTYSLDLIVATPRDRRKMRVTLDGNALTGPIEIPNTGGWRKWETVMTDVNLVRGIHMLRVHFDRGGLNFVWIDVHPIGHQ